VYCPQCGQLIVETFLGHEADKVIHRYTKHDPVAGAVLGFIASVVVTVLVTKLWKALQ